MAVYTLSIQGRAVEVQVDEPSLPSPEETAWLSSLQEGTTASDAELQQAADELAEANRIASLDMDQYAAERRRLGLSRSTLDFLSGR